MLARFLLEVLVVLLVARAVSQFVGGLRAGLRPPGAGGRAGTAMRVQMERDPVCGTFVVPRPELSIAGAEGRVYFCSSRCREAYRARTA